MIEFGCVFVQIVNDGRLDRYKNRSFFATQISLFSMSFDV